MAVREFDGVDDRIVTDNGAVGQLANGALTLFALVKASDLTGQKSIVSAVSGSNWVAAFMQDSHGWALADDNDFVGGLALSASTSSWQLIAVTLSAPGGNPRFHHKLRGSGSWTHTTTGSAWAGSTIAATTCEFGSTNSGSFSSWWNGRLAVAAVFDTALSDGDIETFETTPATQTIYDLGPLALWDFNQASTGTAVLDLTGGGADQSSIAGTTVVNGDDPPGWAYGISTAAPAITARFDKFPKQKMRRGNVYARGGSYSA